MEELSTHFHNCTSARCQCLEPVSTQGLTDIEYPEYHKPDFDPFEVFSPSKSFLQNVQADLKHRAGQVLSEIEQCRSLQPEWLFELKIEHLTDRHRRLCSAIRRYDHYLHRRGAPGGITDADIEHARRQHITDFYQGKLRKFGNRYIGLCPFHSEDTPSFTIYESQNSWWCYGCSQGGDVIDFVRKLHSLEFIQAIKYILNL